MSASFVMLLLSNAIPIPNGDSNPSTNQLSIPVGMPPSNASANLYNVTSNTSNAVIAILSGNNFSADHLFNFSSGQWSNKSLHQSNLTMSILAATNISAGHLFNISSAKWPNTTSDHWFDNFDLSDFLNFSSLQWLKNKTVDNWYGQFWNRWSNQSVDQGRNTTWNLEHKRNRTWNMEHMRNMSWNFGRKHNRTWYTEHRYNRTRNASHIDVASCANSSGWERNGIKFECFNESGYMTGYRPISCVTDFGREIPVGTWYNVSSSRKFCRQTSPNELSLFEYSPDPDEFGQPVVLTQTIGKGRNHPHCPNNASSFGPVVVWTVGGIRPYYVYRGVKSLAECQADCATVDECYFAQVTPSSRCYFLTASSSATCQHEAAVHFGPILESCGPLRPCPSVYKECTETECPLREMVAAWCRANGEPEAALQCS